MTDAGAGPKQVPVNIQRSGEYWVLVPQEAGEVAVVNATGYHIFQQCDGSRSLDHIAHSIAATSGVDVERVRCDVAAFIARLESVGLLAQ